MALNPLKPPTAARSGGALRPAMLRRAIGLALLALPVAACSHVDPTVAESPIAFDFHQRHPIVLTGGRHPLDIFVAGARGASLDYRQKHDVEAFAAAYRAGGQGRVRALLPRGGVDPRAVEATLLAVRRTLAAAGVRGELEVGTYVAADPRLASVIRLSFVELQARGATRCGEWPEDLGTGSSFTGWDNHPYYNLGCSTQQNLAAQVDDPRDFVRPRAEEPGDVQMRTRAIGDLRGVPTLTGQDPSTTFSQSALTAIGGGH